jgi:OmpA-OmpF porin, OOP family
MLKKVLTTAVLGVSALGVMAANAAPGVYVTGQLGYANTHMGPKANINQLSFGQGDEKALVSIGGPSLANNGLAGRLAIGYQFNQNFAVELGYLQLASKKANKTFTTVGEDPVSVVAATKLNQNAIDLALKGILPIASNFNVYGKLGAAYLTTTGTATFDLGDLSRGQVPNMTVAANQFIGVAKHKWAPEAAVGVSYNLTQNVSVDTSWTHIQPVGKNRPGNIDFVAVGLGYSFG